MKTDYETLREEFDDKIKELQNSCLHEEKEWVMKGSKLHPLRITHKILVCKNCNKTLEKKKK